MKKKCKQCGISFTPSRKDKQYCSERCAIIFYSRSARERKRERTVRLCVICGKRITEKGKSKLCSEECRKEQARRKSKESARKRVREAHAKKPKKNCLSCGIVLETTVRNYHQLERCPPCQESRNKLRSKNFYEENKEKQKAYFKERHAKKMQDPEYKKKNNARSQARRDANPVIANCVICESSFRKIRSKKTCGKECSLELRKRQDRVLRQRMNSSSPASR
jgi:predicted nucleic acid-binding Zn ribbon protein